MPFHEIDTVQAENRYELVLSGPTVSETIDDEGFDERVYSCTSLNFLEISNTSLGTISSKLGNLINLTNLVLRGNVIAGIPAEIKFLTKLKLVDISRNELTSVPDEMSKLNALHSLNLSTNKLTALPDLANLQNLSILDVSYNNISVFPASLVEKSLIHLTDLNLSHNALTDLPVGLVDLPALKVLDVSDNEITSVPGEIADCSKLKEIKLQGNKLKDRRLSKLVVQCHYKQIMDYIRNHCPKENLSGNETGSSKSKGKGKKKKNASTAKDDTAELTDMMRVIHVSDDTPIVKSTEAVKDVRPNIIFCIIRGVKLNDAKVFKDFISLQTKLHDTICEKRNLATIASHDLHKISGNLLYDAKAPDNIMILPLKRSKEVSANKLYQQLRDEAEALRKEKKRNTFSGIHKYLYLLDHKTNYPCLIDSSGCVISFPPITNSDLTKISESTTDILLEVSSSSSLPACKQIMDKLLYEILHSDLSEVNDQSIAGRKLVIEQVRVEDQECSLKAVYPSRADLIYDDVNIIRE